MNNSEQDLKRDRHLEKALVLINELIIYEGNNIKIRVLQMVFKLITMSKSK